MCDPLTRERVVEERLVEERRVARRQTQDVLGREDGRVRREALGVEDRRRDGESPIVAHPAGEAVDDLREADGSLRVLVAGALLGHPEEVEQILGRVELRHADVVSDGLQQHEVERQAQELALMGDDAARVDLHFAQRTVEFLV